MQKAYFPMKYITLTNGYGKTSGSHQLSYALDLAGKDGGQDEIFAPFDCKITGLYQPRLKNGAIDTSKAPEVWLTSLEKVKCANGKEEILTMSLTHSTEIYNMKKGQIFKQFSLVCHEGNQGISYGNHIHLELSVGNNPGWDQSIAKKYKAYVNINKVKPEEYLFVDKNSKVLSNSWTNIYGKKEYLNFILDKDEPTPSEKYTKGIYRCDCNIRIRTGAGTNYSTKKVKDCTSEQKAALTSKISFFNAVFKKGTNITALEIIKNDKAEYWLRTYNYGYVCIEDNSSKYLTKI